MLYVLILFLVILDQWTKYLISTQFELHQIYPIIDSFFSITYYHNSGGAFSFLAETDWGIILLSVISIIVSTVILFFIVRLKNMQVFWIRFSMALLVSGSIGNMIDRVRTGAVIDFLMFTFGSYTFPIFNVADICIVVGSCLLAFFMIIDKKIFETKNTDAADHPDDTEDKSVPFALREGESTTNDI
jgi:signal peptidase II